jgi:hypothetical protein
VAFRIFLVHPVEHRKVNRLGVNQLDIVAPATQPVDRKLGEPPQSLFVLRSGGPRSNVGLQPMHLQRISGTGALIGERDQEKIIHSSIVVSTQRSRIHRL